MYDYEDEEDDLFGPLLKRANRQNKKELILKKN